MTKIATWLYTSEFPEQKTPDEIDALAKGFAERNHVNELSGFMISNGIKVMQLLEGSPKTVAVFRDKITADSRHTNVHPEVWDISDHRAYPNWSMRSISVDDYEILFEEIERTEIQTLAIKIASVLFDATFQSYND